MNFKRYLAHSNPVYMEIYDVIREFYPIGIPKDGSLFFEGLGWKKFEMKLVENLHNKKQFEKTWNSISNTIERIIPIGRTI